MRMEMMMEKRVMVEVVVVIERMVVDWVVGVGDFGEGGDFVERGKSGGGC